MSATSQIFVLLSLSWDGSGFLRVQKKIFFQNSLLLSFGGAAWSEMLFFFFNHTEDNYSGWQYSLCRTIETPAGLLLSFQSQGGREHAGVWKVSLGSLLSKKCCSTLWLILHAEALCRANIAWCHALQALFWRKQCEEDRVGLSMPIQHLLVLPNMEYQQKQAVSSNPRNFSFLDASRAADLNFCSEMEVG